MQFTFADIVDVPGVQKLMDQHWRATGIPSAIVDIDGNVLVESGWQSICTIFHRQHPETASRCRESDNYLTRRLQDGIPLPPCGYVEYRCQNGLIDIALPINIEGRHLANFFFGQFFYEPPDHGFFRQQAARFGFDAASYLEALQKVPIYTPQKVSDILNFNASLVNLLTSMGVERLRQLEAAESANRAKNEFLANMSHELRTPLTSITLLHELLRASTLDEKQARYLEMAKTASDRLLVLINDILDLSRIEAGTMEITATDFSLQSSITEEIHRLRPSLDNKGLSFTLDLPEEMPDLVTADRLRFRQILHNLLINAVKFTAEGAITLSARLMDKDGERLLIQFDVTDTGIGIEPPAMQRIFEPFEQEDGSSSRRHGGTGIGLALCRRLAEMMGGKIWADSVPGAGSSFHLLLPFITLAETNQLYPGGEMSSSAKASMPPLSVLLVEDNVMNRRLMQAMLQKMGHRVATARNGAEGVETWAGGTFDLVLMDVQMPVMDGIEATRRIREAEAEHGGHTPIIALTAFAFANDRQRLLAAGFDRHLAKPATPQALIREIRQLLPPG